MNPTLLGLASGTLMAAISIGGNVRKDDPHVVSTFPNLVTLAAVPLVLALAFLALRSVKLDRAAFGAAGRHVTVVSAVVFGLVLGMFTWYWLRSFGLATYTAGTSFIATIILGFLVSLLYARERTA